MRFFTKKMSMIVLILAMSACANHEALLYEIRTSLVQSTKPALQDAFEKVPEDTYIVEYKEEKLNTVDAIIESIDRVMENK